MPSRKSWRITPRWWHSISCITTFVECIGRFASRPQWKPGFLITSGPSRKPSECWKGSEGVKPKTDLERYQQEQRRILEDLDWRASEDSLVETLVIRFRTANISSTIAVSLAHHMLTSRGLDADIARPHHASVHPRLLLDVSRAVPTALHLLASTVVEAPCSLARCDAVTWPISPW